MESCSFSLRSNPEYAWKIATIGEKTLKKLAEDSEYRKAQHEAAYFIKQEAGLCFSDKSPEAQRTREIDIVEQMRLTVCGKTPPYNNVTIQEVNQVSRDLGAEKRIECTAEEDLARLKL
jgi:hypothetical protein